MEFDYIIVGAGTAGCVLAERLTADGRNRVLLLEAGAKPLSPFVRIPAGFAKLFASRFDWGFVSEPQTNADGRTIFIPRGRMLGGSSNMNAQIHQWGRPEDFDAWLKLGLSDWSWARVQPYFAEIEAAESVIPGNHRGRGGAMRVVRNAHVHPATLDFVRAARTRNRNCGPTYNGACSEGAWVAEIAQHRGRRFSAYDAFLKPALRRPNLQVLTGSPAHRITFVGRRATGLALAGRKVQASRGVLLAAGTFGSPQLLMLSGIGPASSLHAAGIEPLLDMPAVGADLHDQPMAVLSFPTAHRDTYKNAESLQNLLRYLLQRGGPLASNAAEAVAFARSSQCRGSPDMELIFAPFEWRNQALEPPQIHALSIGAVVNAPRSRGSVRLSDRNLSGSPRIDFGLFSDPGDHDRRVMIEAVEWMHEVLRHPVLAKHLRTVPDLPADPDAIFELALTGMQTVYHPAGTCRMGVDADAVVTPDLKLSGCENLWVADASIMPQLPSGHPNATIAMIGARAADFIKGEERRAAGRHVRVSAQRLELTDANQSEG